MVCSFFLQLSLLDLPCAAYSPSLVAAAALSNAFELFNKDSWLQSLQQHSAYDNMDVHECKDRLKEMQATTQLSTSDICGMRSTSTMGTVSSVRLGQKHSLPWLIHIKCDCHFWHFWHVHHSKCESTHRTIDHSNYMYLNQLYHVPSRNLCCWLSYVLSFART